MKHNRIINLSMALVIGVVGSLFAGTYQVDNKSSDFKWTGRKVIGEHYGKVLIKSGYLDVTNGKLKGQFVMDMTSITNDDISNNKFNKKLVDHLKDEDFFNVSEFPTSTFKITRTVKKEKGTEYIISGQLTIKGISKEISFPANVVVGQNTLEASANFKIDRTRWGIRYGSGSFFSGLGDKAIDNEIEYNIKLKAHNKTENRS